MVFKNGDRPRNRKHWLEGTRVYYIRRNMINRCRYKLPWSKYYYDKWISVCEERVASILSFLDDMWYPPTKEHSIDRIDNAKWYYKENCRRVHKSEQNRNKSSNIVYKGKCLKQRCRVLWVPYSRVYARVVTRWRDIKKALYTKKMKQWSKDHLTSATEASICWKTITSNGINDMY